jgi:hypothetical protein
MSRDPKQFVDHRARLFVLAGRVRYAVTTGGEANCNSSDPRRRSPASSNRRRDQGAQVSARFFSRVAEEKN